jgi:hypothetical protein
VWCKKVDLPELALSEASLLTIRKLLGFDDPLDNEISVRVQPMSYGRFGVYANWVLIAICPDHAAAYAYCLRLRNERVAIPQKGMDDSFLTAR